MKYPSILLKQNHQYHRGLLLQRQSNEFMDRLVLKWKYALIIKTKVSFSAYIVSHSLLTYISWFVFHFCFLFFFFVPVIFKSIFENQNKLDISNLIQQFHSERKVETSSRLLTEKTSFLSIVESSENTFRQPVLNFPSTNKKKAY